MSERATAHRNFALAYHMMEHNSFPPNYNIQSGLDMYFQVYLIYFNVFEVLTLIIVDEQTCSLEIDCEALSVMGATLANGGKCPINDKKVLRQEIIRDVLSLMFSCGMYNSSGEFAFSVSYLIYHILTGLLRFESKARSIEVT